MWADASFCLQSTISQLEVRRTQPLFCSQLLTLAGPILEASIGSGLVLSRVQTETTCEEGQIQQLSWKPRVTLYRGFLSSAECDFLIANSREKLGA